MLRAAYTPRKQLVAFFCDVFRHMRDLAVLRCDGLSSKELILLRMVAAAPCAADVARKRPAKVGMRVLNSLISLGEAVIREFFLTTVRHHVSSKEDYESAASSYQCEGQTRKPAPLVARTPRISLYQHLGCMLGGIWLSGLPLASHSCRTPCAQGSPGVSSQSSSMRTVRRRSAWLSTRWIAGCSSWL